MDYFDQFNSKGFRLTPEMTGGKETFNLRLDLLRTEG